MPPQTWGSVIVRWETPYWTVESSFRGRVILSKHSSKEQAIWHARQRARTARPSRLIVYDTEGNEERLFNYPAEKHKSTY